MAQNTNPSIIQNPLWQRPLLIQSFSWLSSLSVLSGGIALAQAPATIPDTAVQPVETVSSLLAPAPVLPESIAPASVTPDFSPNPQPIQRSAKTSGAPSAPAANRDDYGAPTAIVLSERSTGCQSVVRSGQRVLGSSCDTERGSANSNVGRSGALSAMQVGAIPTGLGATSSLKDYYYRTTRPPGMLGNGNIRLIFPLSIPAAISSAFGWRTHPITGEQRFHAGTDLAAPLGTPVLAAYAGRVAIADFLGGYGLTVALEHSKGTQQTLYGHMSELFVKPGEWVEQGTVIGRVGTTGFSTGPHLHFEFRQLTPDGWVAMDAGTQLEYALAQLVKAIQTAQAQNTQVRNQG